jgi:hypothetical protein
MVLHVFVGGILLDGCLGLNPKWLLKGGGGSAGRVPSFTYTLKFTLHLRKITENVNPGSREELGIFLSVNLAVFVASRCY